MKAIVKGKVLYYAYEVDISEISYAFDKFSKNVMVVNADRRRNKNRKNEDENFIQKIVLLS